MLSTCMGRDEFVWRLRKTKGLAFCRKSSREDISYPTLDPIEICYSYVHVDSKGRI